MKKGTIILTIIFLILKLSAGYAQYSKLLDFTGASNGEYPSGTLISDGTFLYGMTRYGGVNSFGTIFKIKTDGTGYIKLLDFAGASNGKFPLGSLVSDGVFMYGMTSQGGTVNNGTIFRIKTDGTGFIKLMDFTGTANGSVPNGTLFFNGTLLFGMTSTGGTYNHGTIFKIQTDGTGYIKLLDFDNATNGGDPVGSFVSDGTYLYGVTNTGGAFGLGLVYKIMPNGTGYVDILDLGFAFPEGYSPNGSLLYDGTFLYGMTNFGGTNYDGTIFKVKPDGTGYMRIFSFIDPIFGSKPRSNLISDGTFLYGMTSDGSASGDGVIFKIMPDGSLYEKLYECMIFTDGRYPSGGLFSDGTFLYGVTGIGGLSDMGVLFKQCIPSLVTQNANILTANITGATYQWVNCDSNLAPIVGATFQSFTADSSGNFAVIVTQNTCSEMSSCYNVTGSGISNYSLGGNISIHPNPAQTNIFIDLDFLQQKKIVIEIKNIIGQNIYSEDYIWMETNQSRCIDISAFSKGFYFVEITFDNKKIDTKFIKQ